MWDVLTGLLSLSDYKNGPEYQEAVWGTRNKPFTEEKK